MCVSIAVGEAKVRVGFGSLQHVLHESYGNGSAAIAQTTERAMRRVNPIIVCRPVLSLAL
jgi:hypothetical protein